MTDSLPLAGDDASRGAGGNAAAHALFTDPSTDFVTDEVFDADREVVYFDPALGAMVWGASGDAVSGWTTNGTDLRWSRSGIAFQVRFGTEQGERRAYFTETATGTICNLTISAPERLSIFGTSEPPPQE